MMMKRLLRRDTKGIGAVEFALVAPVLISFVIGISQMGRLFYANADMKNAIASGARVASVWPVPEDEVILAAVNGRLARSGGIAAADVDLARATDESGNDYVDISMSYNVPLDFIFFDIGPITLRDTRRVFIQMDSVRGASADGTGCTSNCGGTEDPPTDGGTTTGGDTSTGGTTTGGDTSTGGTTTGGDTSTGGTTTGGDTSTGGTTTGGTTTGGTTTGGTTSSGNGNGSSGNSNGNSGHGHGNCNKNC